jgi:predicted amidohydrolase
MKKIVLIVALILSLSAAWGAAAKSVRLAVCQILVIDSDREGNFRRIEYALDQAAAQHANIALFPESSILGWENPEAHQLAQPIPGLDSDRLATLARKYKLMIASVSMKKTATTSTIPPRSSTRTGRSFGSIARSMSCPSS